MSADENRDILQVPLEELSRTEVDSRCRYLEDRMRALLVLLEPIQKNADSLLQINETLETELKTAKNIRVAHESLMNMTYRHEERMKQDVKGLIDENKELKQLLAERDERIAELEVKILECEKCPEVSILDSPPLSRVAESPSERDKEQHKDWATKSLSPYIGKTTPPRPKSPFKSSVSRAQHHEEK